MAPNTAVRIRSAHCPFLYLPNAQHPTPNALLRVLSLSKGVAKSLQYPFYEDYPLVHIAGPLLAIGYCLTFSLSHHLVVAPPISYSWDCGRGGASIDWSDFYVAGENPRAVTSHTVQSHLFLYSLNWECIGEIVSDTLRWR